MPFNYELITPSDPVTFTAPTYLSAVGSVLLVGHGHYWADCIDADGEPLDENNVPFLLFTPALDQWLHRNDLTLSELFDDNRADIIKTLRSFCTGTWRERELFDTALAAITEPEKRKQFLFEWDDRRRTSLNEITNRAHSLADSLAAKAAAESKGETECSV